MASQQQADLVVIGGGAAGYFTAIKVAEENPDAEILILEKGKKPLEKVRISGGGRCNVTHGCFIPKDLSKHYPRGEKELLGPFHTFMTGDMMGWLEDRGVETKIEDDGRVFPITDSSETIIDCFETSAEKLGIKVRLGNPVRALAPSGDHWIVETDTDGIQTKTVLFATGSANVMWKMLSALDVKCIPPVPSLFTFKIKSPLLEGLMGLSVPAATATINKRLSAKGPMLITHWGLSGPAILKLSAWGARILSEVNHHFDVRIQWTEADREDVADWIEDQRKENPKKSPVSTVFPDIPKRLWERMIHQADMSRGNWSDQKKKSAERLIELLADCRFEVKGKSTFKEEFVTAGGVDLKEINFKTMEHKRLPNLYFAGEVLNIDAITGGFNFQACWTGGFIAGKAIAERISTFH